jgi:hypothetical protein
MPSRHAARLSAAGVALIVGMTGCKASSRAEWGPALASQLTAANASEIPPPEKRGHMDHRPHHGGVVLMNGDVHFELVMDPRGRHAIYFTDEMREPIPPARIDGASLDIARRGAYTEHVELAPSGDHFVATGRWLLGSELSVRLGYASGGEPYFIDIPYEKRGLAGDVRGPHGGMLAPLSPGSIELLAQQSGRFDLWLLDGAQATRAPSAATARVQVAQAGFAEVELAPEGDRLTGKGPVLWGNHPSITVLYVEGERRETLRFTLHLEHHDASGDHAAHD